MSVIIFNSKKKFWNPVTRVYQDEPGVIDESEYMMTRIMAINSDDTCDVLRFETVDTERSKKFIEKMNIDKNYIAIARDMNRKILKAYRKMYGNSDH